MDDNETPAADNAPELDAQTSRSDSAAATSNSKKRTRKAADSRSGDAGGKKSADGKSGGKKPGTGSRRAAAITDEAPHVADRDRAALLSGDFVHVDGETLPVRKRTIDDVEADYLRGVQTVLALAALPLLITALLSYQFGLRHSDGEETLRPVVGASIGTPSRSEIVGDDAMGRMYAARVILRPGSGLVGPAGDAPAWVLDAGDVNREQFLRTLGDAIGATGDIRDDEWQLSIGSVDGMTATAWIGRDRNAFFGAYDPTRSPWTCVTATPMTKEPATLSSTSSADEPATGVTSAGSVGMTTPGFAPDVACDPVGKAAPSNEDAIASVRALLRKLEIGLEDKRFNATTYDQHTSVTVTTAVKEFALPWTMNFEVGGNGIFSLNGTLAQAQPLPSYPIVDAVTATARSTDPRWSTLGPVQLWDDQNFPMPAVMSREIDDMSADTPTTGTGPASAEMPTSVSEPEFVSGSTATVRTVNGRPVLDGYVTEIVVVEARIGLGMFTLADGRTVLLPVWEYRGEDGSRWAMIAVTDQYVKFNLSR